MKQYVVEFIGAFFLLLAMATGEGLAVGAMLAVLTYVGWYISGAHYNPAITTTAYTITKVTTHEYMYYLGAQLLGAFAGSIFWFLITGQQWIIDVSGAPLWLVVVFESVMTFLFGIVFLAVIDLFQRRNAQEYGLIIGLALMAVVFLRGVINPAIVAGSLLFFVCINGYEAGMITPFLGYLIGPFLGAWMAAHAHKYLHVE
jgi:glycerol uptake facilitator-like aquaporin